MQRLSLLAHVRTLHPRAKVSADAITPLAGLTWVMREGTTDWNTVNACTAADEYGLAGIEVKDKLVFDIGAHVGGVGVWLASRGATVVMVEPLHDNVQHILSNLHLNGLDATVIEAALGASRIYLGPEGDAHEFIGGTAANEDARGCDVAEVTFDSLVRAFGAPDIVKLDCEGGEWGAFHDPAIRQVPLIVGEYHPDPHGDGYTSADIFEYLPGHEVTVGENPTFDAFRAVLLPSGA